MHLIKLYYFMRRVDIMPGVGSKQTVFVPHCCLYRSNMRVNVGCFKPATVFEVKNEKAENFDSHEWVVNPNFDMVPYRFLDRRASSHTCHVPPYEYNQDWPRAFDAAQRRCYSIIIRHGPFSVTQSKHP